MADEGPYVCIHCGAKCSALIKVYNTPTNIRLLPCTNCGARSRDHYVEYDLILVFIDLALVRLSAYRHIMFNKLPRVSDGLSTKGFIQLWIMFLHLDAYSKWLTCIRVSGSQLQFSVLNSWLKWHESHIMVLLLVLSESAVYIIVIFIGSWFIKAPTRLAITIGNFGKLGNLIMMVWDTQNLFMRTALDVFVSLAHMMCLQACMPNPHSLVPAGIILCAWLARSMFSYAIAQIYGPEEMTFVWFPPEALVLLEKT